MAILKRKSVARVAGKHARAGKVSKVGMKAKKQPAKKQKAERKPKDVEREADEVEEDKDPDEEVDEQEEDVEEEKVSDEDKIKQEEDELQASRKKELKGMYIDALKELATSKGVEPCKKEDMIDAVVAAEAKERADARAHQAKLRAVVVQKKDELEALPLPELRELCSEYGIKGQLTKHARIEQIMKLWQEADGVDKALAKRARDERVAELEGMEKAVLRKLCDKAGVEPFVKQVMVERLVRVETAAGKFARPTLPVDPSEEDEKPKKGKKADMVDELLESEARRKKEAEIRKQKDEAEAQKRKELKAMSVEELKKILTKKGHDATGKKDDMVETLHHITMQEEAVAARKAKLRSMALDDLRKLVTSRGLAAGKKDDMADAILEHEAQCVEVVKAYESKVEEAVAKLKEGFEAKSAAELKDLCASRNLKLGSSKETRIDILLEDAKINGAVSKAVVDMAIAARISDLTAKEESEVLQLCDGLGVDPLVKEVLVERLLAYESEFGRVEPDETQKAKRARKC